MTAVDAADLERCRQGVEPLRVVITAPHRLRIIQPVIEPIPVIV